MTRDGGLLGKHETQDFRIHYKINATFALEMCCSLCSRKQGTSDCNCALAAPPAGTIHASLQNRLQLQWSQLNEGYSSTVGFNCSASPCKNLLEKTSPEQRDITPVGGHCIISPPKILDTSYQCRTPLPDAAAKTLGCTSQGMLTDGNQFKKSLQELGETWKTFLQFAVPAEA